MKKWLFIFLILLVIFLGAAGFFTDFAFKTIWLPRLGKSLGLDIKTEKVDWHPLSSVALSGVTFSAKQKGVSGRLDEVRLEYDLKALKRGSLMISNFVADSGVVQWDLTQKQTFNSAKKDVAEKEDKKSEVVLRRSSSTGFQIESGPLVLKNIQLATTLPSSQGGKLFATNSINQFWMSGYHPDQETRMTLENEFSGQPSLGVTIDRAKMKAEFRLILDADFLFRTGQGSVQVSNIVGKSGDWSLAGYEIQHEFELEPYRLKHFSISVRHEGKNCGELKASGPVDFNLKTADLVMTWSGVSPILMNLGLAPLGWRMESGELSASGQFQMLKESIRLQGEALLKEGKIHRIANPTSLPLLDGNMIFATEWFPKQQALQVDRVEMNLKQDQQPFAEAKLDQGIRLSWNPNQPGEEQATLNVKVFPTDVMLFKEAWRGLPHFTMEAGALEGVGKIVASQSGREIHWDWQGHFENVKAQLQRLTLNQATAELATEGSVLNFQKFNLKQLRLALMEQNETQGELAISGFCDKQKGKFDGTIKGELPWLASILSQQLALTQGKVDGKFEMGWADPEAKSAKFLFNANNLSGEWGKLSLVGAQANCEGALQTAGQEMRLQQVKIRLRPAASAKEGQVLITGLFNNSAKTLNVKGSLQDWTQDNLAPFFKNWNPQAEIQSLNGNFTLEDQGSTRFFDLDLRAKKVLIPNKISAVSFDSQPSDVEVKITAAGNRPRLEVSEGLLKLEPSNGYNNEVNLSGWWESDERFDLKLETASFDLSPIAGLCQKGEGSKKSLQQEEIQDSSLAKPVSQGMVTNLIGHSDTNRLLVSTSFMPPKQDKDKPFKNVDRKVVCSAEKLFLPPYPQAKIRFTWHQEGKKFTWDPLEIQMGEGTINGNWTGAVAGNFSPFELNLKSHNLRLEPFQNFVKPETKPYLQGLLDADIALKGAGSQWAILQKTLNGKINLKNQEAHLELIPATQSFLRSAARYVSPELANTKFDSVSGDFSIGNGRVKTENMKLQGDLMRLAMQGKLDFDQDLNLTVVFTGKKDVLERAQVKVGDFQIGGGIFVSLGKTENGYTTLPGQLPVRGKLPNEVKAEWEKWLISIGQKAAPTAVQDLLNQFLH
ncbi:MAG: AsmA-like C-terminal region-containing protein [Verrucomicrobiae bacterium]|nr:AsmA-like C-terminal region-containing protein [Verrucomicrobiae bacterium]